MPERSKDGPYGDQTLQAANLTFPMPHPTFVCLVIFTVSVCFQSLLCMGNLSIAVGYRTLRPEIQPTVSCAIPYFKAAIINIRDIGLNSSARRYVYGYLCIRKLKTKTWF